MATQALHQEDKKPVTWSKFVVRMIIFSALFPLGLFVAAGTVNWLMGWVYVILLIGLTAISRYLMIRRNPELLEERSRALSREDTKSWDKILVPLIVIGPLIQVIIAGLDLRYDWSPPFTLGLELVGVGLLLIGYLFASWAMLVNAYYSSVVRIQTDRGQQVVTEGPYRIVRHPSYIGAVIGNVGTSLILSSWWSFIPVVAVTVVFIIRTALEDRTLHNELPGYAEFARQTRYRLIPGVW